MKPNAEITRLPVLLMIVLFDFRWSTNLVAESQQFVIFTTEQVLLFDFFLLLTTDTNDED